MTPGKDGRTTAPHRPSHSPEPRRGAARLQAASGGQVTHSLGAAGRPPVPSPALCSTPPRPRAPPGAKAPPRSRPRPAPGPAPPPGRSPRQTPGHARVGATPRSRPRPLLVRSIPRPAWSPVPCRVPEFGAESPVSNFVFLPLPSVAR